MTVDFELPKHPVGTKFSYRMRRSAHEAEVVGYWLTHATDTGEGWSQYRIQYEYMGQTITAIVPRATVDRALLGAST